MTIYVPLQETLVVKLSGMDALLSSPLKRETSVKCFWRQAALLNGGRSASQTWPPFPGTAGVHHPTLLRAGTLSIQTDAHPGLTAPLSGPPFSRRAACWCFALTLCIAVVSLTKHGAENLQCPRCEREAADWWKVGVSLRPDMTYRHPARDNMV